MRTRRLHRFGAGGDDADAVQPVAGGVAATTSPGSTPGTKSGPSGPWAMPCPRCPRRSMVKVTRPVRLRADEAARIAASNTARKARSAPEGHRASRFSTICPRSSTMIRSIAAMVDRRVRNGQHGLALHHAAQGLLDRRLHLAVNALVASSSTRIGASFRKARARAIAAFARRTALPPLSQKGVIALAAHGDRPYRRRIHPPCGTGGGNDLVLACFGRP